MHFPLTHESIQPMTRTFALTALSLLVALAPSAWLAAKDLDGLDAATRKVFYNDQTVVVARTALAGLEPDKIEQALQGLFYRERLARVGPVLKSNAQSIDEPLNQPRLLALQGFTHVTSVGIDKGGGEPAMFHLVKLGEKLMDDTNFSIWKFGLTGLVKGTQVTKLGGYAVLHPEKTTLPDPAGHRQSVENVVLQGLAQPPETATVNWVMLPRKAVQDLVKGMLGSDSNWAGLTSDVSGATYTGGYLTTGARPELMIYVRFADESKAAAMKQAYDDVWKKEIVKSAASDQAKLASIAKRKREGVDTSAEEADLVKYPSGEATMTRFSTALPGKAFGHMFMITMTQNNLRELSAAVMDAFLGKE